MEITLKDVLKVFKRFSMLILAITLLSAIVVGLYTHIAVGSVFESKSEMQWSKGANLDTCMEYVRGDAILTQTSNEISNKYNITKEELKEMIVTEKSGSSNVFTITVSHPDSGTSYYICKTITENIPSVFEQFGITVQIVNLPLNKPEYINDVYRNALIGAAAGFFVAVVVSLILYNIFKTICYRSDIEKYFDVKIVGAVPHKNKDNALNLLGVNALDTAFNGDCKRVAVASIGQDKKNCLFLKIINTLFGRGNDCFCQAGQDLALSVSKLGKKTLYIDAKMTFGNSSVFGVDSKVGLSDYLAGKCELTVTESEIKNLSVITAGGVVEETTAQLTSVKMKELLDKLSKQFDCIILDLPSIGTSADAVSVNRSVDGYILTVKAGANSVVQLNNAMGALSQISARIHGLILNDANPLDVFGGRTLVKRTENN